MLAVGQEAEYVFSKTTKFYGSAGTGKTSTLKNKIEEEITNNGILPEEIAYLTFTKKEAKHGLQVISSLGFQPKELKWFRTIHSACFRLLELDRTMIITDKERKEFFDECSISFMGNNAATDPEYILEDIANLLLNPGDYVKSNIKEGNIFLAIIDWCKQSYPTLENPLDKAAKCPLNDPDFFQQLFNKGHIRFTQLNVDYLKRVHEKYTEFKNARGLYDFTDLLDFVYKWKKIPPVKVLIVDEAQDLSPLQWAVIDCWIKDPSIKRVYLAGDYNQAIYSFAGAVPRFLKNYPGKIHFIPVTHRFGEKILEYSKRVIKDPLINNLRVCKDPSCPCQQNSKDNILMELDVLKLPNILQNNYIEKRETFCLFRTNRLMHQFTKYLIESGIPFKKLSGANIWTDKTTKTGNNLVLLNNILFRLRYEDKTLWSFSFAEYCELIKVLDSKRIQLIRGLKTDIKRVQDGEEPKTYNKDSVAINLKTLAEKNKVTYHTLYNSFKKRDIIEPVLKTNNIFSYLKLSDLQVLALQYSKSFIHPGNICIELSTIHKAKGQERKDVILFTDINKLIVKTMSSNSYDEEERRVFYVGVTRARERLFVIKNFFATHYNYFLPSITPDKANILYYNRIHRKLLTMDPNTTQPNRPSVVKDITALTDKEIVNMIYAVFLQSDNDRLKREEVYNSLNIPENRFNAVFDYLFERGDLYEPKTDYYKLNVE